MTFRHVPVCYMPVRHSQFAMCQFAIVGLSYEPWRRQPPFSPAGLGYVMLGSSRLIDVVVVVDIVVIVVFIVVIVAVAIMLGSYGKPTGEPAYGKPAYNELAYGKMTSYLSKILTLMTIIFFTDICYYSKWKMLSCWKMIFGHFSYLFGQCCSVFFLK